MFRRNLVVTLGPVLALAALPSPARAERPRLLAFRDPCCGCCLG